MGLRTVLFAKAESFDYSRTMKFFAALIIALFLAVPALRAQQSPDDQYVIIYVLIQQGDASLNAGEPQQALQNYTEAQRELQKFAEVYSDWNPKIVNFRLTYLADKIAALTPQTIATNAPSVAPTPPPTPADWQAQLATLNGKIQQLEGDSETLNAKLKEALSAQPATVSADAYARMQEQVRELTKENDLLKATVAQATNTVSAAPAPAPAPQANPQLQQALTQEQQALAQETAHANQLAEEDDALEARILTLTTDANAADALRQENALLKKELTSLNSTPAAAGNNTLGVAPPQVSEMRSDATADWLEKAGLENRVRQWQEAALNSAAQAAPGQEEAGEVQTLRARVAVDEAQAVPYNAQERALFVPQPLTPNSKSALPGGAAVLVAEAQNYATNREYNKAAADYQEILQRDPNNSGALANLAAVELEQNQVADADKHIHAALIQQPDDPFNLAVLGRVKFSEGDYDDALDSLSRAAQLDPQDPQIENFLGVALAQKGLRTQAETAFRKAVEIDPDYGDAHKNLAIFYLGANPPQVELARWHYEKALAAGVPPNPDLEKMLSAHGGAQQ
jgi:tetratricopeptide (TPR) repeat protein